MALIDNQLMFSDAQALTATASSTNVVDMGTGRNLGGIERLFLLLQFGAVTSNATLYAVVKGADDAGISTNVVSVLTTRTITPVANTYFVQPMPPAALKRYWRVDYTMSGGSSPSITTSATFIKDAEVHLYAQGSAAYY